MAAADPAELARRAKATRFIRGLRADLARWTTIPPDRLQRMTVGELLVAHDRAIPRVMSTRPGRATSCLD